MEVAQYSIKPDVSRIVFPQFFKLVVLCAMFYGGVWINFLLLRKPFPLWITVLVVIILAILMAAQLVITKSRAYNYHYDFFSNRVEFYGEKLKSALYSDVREIKVERNVFDNFAGTGTVAVSRNFKISDIRNYSEIQNYLNQLIQNYNAHRAQELSQQFYSQGGQVM